MIIWLGAIVVSVFFSPRSAFLTRGIFLRDPAGGAAVPVDGSTELPMGMGPSDAVAPPGIAPTAGGSWVGIPGTACSGIENIAGVGAAAAPGAGAGLCKIR